jgi:hypothetical protein
MNVPTSWASSLFAKPKRQDRKTLTDRTTADKLRVLNDVVMVCALIIQWGVLIYIIIAVTYKEFNRSLYNSGGSRILAHNRKVCAGMAFAPDLGAVFRRRPFQYDR